MRNYFSLMLQNNYSLGFVLIVVGLRALILGTYIVYLYVYSYF